MITCRRIRPVLHRAIEGETTPDESLRLARHLPRCTACRIRLARERRLAELLGVMDDPLPVETSFADHVIRALPEGPPPSPSGVLRWTGKRRGAKLGILAGIVGVAGWLVREIALAGAQGPSALGMPSVGLETGESLADLLVRLVALARLGLDRGSLGGDVGLEFLSWPAAGGVALTMALLAILTFSTGATMAARAIRPGRASSSGS